MKTRRTTNNRYRTLFLLIASSLLFVPGVFAENSPVNDVPELPVTVSVPDHGGNESIVSVTGSISGEPVMFTWDFSPIGAGPFTNGYIDVMQSSSRSVPAVSIQINSGFGGAYFQRPAQWYFSMYLGNFTLEDRVYNSKKAFAIPDAPYALVTLRKGPGGTEYRHREYTPSNLTSAVVERVDWDETTGTLRIDGSFRAEWGPSDWVQADFSVLVGGPSDRNGSPNRSTLRRVFGE